MLARKEDGSQLSGSSAVGRACLVAAHRLNCLPAQGGCRPSRGSRLISSWPDPKDMIQSRLAERTWCEEHELRAMYSGENDYGEEL